MPAFKQTNKPKNFNFITNNIPDLIPCLNSSFKEILTECCSMKKIFKPAIFVGHKDFGGLRCIPSIT